MMARPGRTDGARSVIFLVWRDTTHPDGGGSEIYVERMACWLADHKYDVTIMCAAHANAPRDEVRNGVRFRRRGGRLTVYLHGLAYLCTRPGRQASMVIDVQNGLPFFSPLVRRRPTMVLVHHVHKQQWQIIYPGLRGRLGWWVESKLAPWLYCDAPYLTLSQATAADLMRLGVRPERIHTVHNGIDVPHPAVVGPRSATPTLCVLGRLVPHKRVEHALDVVAQLRPHAPELTLDIIGDGWWRGALERHAAEIDVTNAVHFHGRLTDADRDTVIDRAWAMLAPSVKEGWGIAIMEAAARGVPTVAYNSAGGVRESVLHGVTGLLVDDDITAFTAAAKRLLDDEALRHRLGEAGRLRAKDFDWPTSAGKFRDLVEDFVRVYQRAP